MTRRRWNGKGILDQYVSDQIHQRSEGSAGFGKGRDSFICVTAVHL